MKVLLPIAVALLLMTHLSTPNFLQPSKKENGHEIGLMDLMKQPLFEEVELFHHAASIVTSLEAAPSCHRLAAKNLIESCQSLQDPKENESEILLDQIKSVFAARLAVCELNGAHVSVPPECHAMVATPVAASHGFRCLLGGKRCAADQNTKERSKSAFPNVSFNELRLCLNALESRPQWWTSYSNARQNAVAVCHATRSQIEKDEIIGTHHTLMEASKGAAEGLTTATKRSQEIIKAQESFVKKVESLQLRIFKEFDAQSSFWHNLARRMETDIGEIFGGFSKMVDETASKMLRVNTNIGQAAQDAANLKVAVTESVSELKVQAGSLGQIMEHNKGTALAMQSSINEIQEKGLDAMNQKLQGAQTALESQNQLMERIIYSQIVASERMDYLDGAFTQIVQRISDLDDNVKAHEEALAALMKTVTSYMEENIKLAFALKADLNDARAGLISVISAFSYVFSFSSVIFWVLAFVTVVLVHLVFGSGVARFILAIELTAYVVKIALEYALVHSNTPSISASLKGVIILTISALLISIGSAVRTLKKRPDNNSKLVRKMGWFNKSSL